MKASTYFLTAFAQLLTNVNCGQLGYDLKNAPVSVKLHYEKWVRGPHSRGPMLSGALGKCLHPHPKIPSAATASDDLIFNMNEDSPVTTCRTPSELSIDIFRLPPPCLWVALGWGRGNPIWRRPPSWILKKAQSCVVGNQANLQSFDPYSMFQ